MAVLDVGGSNPRNFEKICRGSNSSRIETSDTFLDSGRYPRVFFALGFFPNFRVKGEK
jgi:hypothetical protein